MRNLKQLLLLCVVALGLATSCKEDDAMCPALMAPTVDKNTIAVGEELLINNSSTTTNDFSYEIAEGDSFVEVLENEGMHYIKGLAVGHATILASNNGGTSELEIAVGDLPILDKDLVFVGDSIRILNASKDLGFTYDVISGSENVSVIDNDTVFYIVGAKGGTAVISLANSFGELEDSVYISNVYEDNGYYVDFQGVKYNIDAATGDAEVAGVDLGAGPNFDVDFSDVGGVLNIWANLYYEKKQFPVKAVGKNSFSDPSDPGNLTVTELIFETGSPIEQIGQYAFYQCDNISKIDLSGCSSLTLIDTASFYAIDNLETLDLSGCTALEAIAYVAFHRAHKLEALDLSDCVSLQAIEEQAFYEADMITELDLSACTSLETIDEQAFYESEKLQSVSLPSSLLTLGKNTFRGCVELQTVDFSACTELSAIELGVFFSCTNLASIDLSACSALTSIGETAFVNAGLSSVEFPASLQRIENNAFLSCDNLSNVDLSPCTGLDFVDYNAFKDCDAAVPVSLPGTAAEWNPSNIIDASNWNTTFTR